MSFESRMEDTVGEVDSSLVSEDEDWDEVLWRDHSWDAAQR